MKSVINVILILVLSFQLKGQITGNGKMTNKSLEFKNIESIEVQFNADITLDFNQDEVISITADENVLEFIGVNFNDGKLLLDQVKWIAPSRLPKITIGCPHLKSVFQGTHSKTQVVNLSGEKFEVQGNVGSLKISGNINTLLVNTTKSSVDLSELEIKNLQIGDNCKSKIVLNKYQDIVISNSAEPRIKYLDKADISDVDKSQAKDKFEKVSFLEFKIKNNSFRLNKFYVKGPNGRGGDFSYGFKMIPYTTRSERWSIGTKVYKESSTGEMTELITVDENFAGLTKNLFE